jgi:hypothetical protein
MDDDYSSIEISEEQAEIQEITFELSDIELNSQRRDVLITRLKEISRLSYIETIIGYCTSYEENKSSMLKEFLYELCSSKSVELQLKLRCAESLNDNNLCIKLLDETTMMTEEEIISQDINFVIIIDYITKLIKDYPKELDNLISYCLKQKTISIVSKFKLLMLIEYNIQTHIITVHEQVLTASPVDKELYIIQVYQMMLKHECLTIELVNILANELNSSDTSDMYKGNIADFMLGLSDLYSEYKSMGQKYISENTKGALYTGKQMIHMISADAERFIDCISVFEHDDDFFESTSRSVMFNSTGCQLSLSRISTDLSVYGSRSVNLKWIFCKSVKYIQSRPEQTMLLQRLVEELQDMSMTCSTGHLFRLMNTFSGLDDFIKIDPYDELRNCVSTRLQKHISAMTEENAEIILNALAEQDESQLQKYLFPTFAHVCSELYNEYVKQGIMSEHIFYEKYRESIMSFSGLADAK